MMFKTVFLLALLCCSAVLAGQSQTPDCDCGDCDCQVIYKWAAITTKSTTYYGANTFMSVRPDSGNTTSLTWIIALQKTIETSGLTVTLEVDRKINECWIPVLQYCDVLFCSTQIPELQAYMALAGLKNSQPAITCPIAKNNYKISNFIPTLSQLGDNVVPGETAVKYNFKFNGQTIITFYIEVDINCANN